MLALVQALNSMDRQILTILTEPLKRDLLLSDLQIGLLTGLFFSLVYCLSGTVLGRLADTGNRATIISGAVAMWSATTALGGLATTFPMLLLSRMGVAIGEGGSAPAASSIIADLFPSERRASAFAVIQCGIAAGVASALLIGGLLAQALGWRAPLIIIGTLGLIIALLCRLQLPEPPRGRNDDPVATVEALRLAIALRQIFAEPAYRWLVLGGTSASFAIYAILNWVPAMFQRSYGWSPAQTGATLSLAFGGAGVVGALMSGRVADKLLARFSGAHAAIPAAAMICAVPLSIVFLSARSAPIALAAAMLVMLVSNAWLPGTAATMQGLMTSRTRALAFALAALVFNLFGLGLGPTVTGALSDMLHKSYGADALRYAMIPAAFAYLIAAGAFTAAARSASRRRHG